MSRALNIIVVTLRFRPYDINTLSPELDSLTKALMSLQAVPEFNQEVRNDLFIRSSDDVAALIDEYAAKGQRVVNLIPLNLPELESDALRLHVAFFTTLLSESEMQFRWSYCSRNQPINSATFEQLRDVLTADGKPAGHELVPLGIATLPL